jgi:hypothetical protein
VLTRPSKYASGTANRGSARRNSLEGFRAEEASASLFAFGVRADYRCVLGRVARSSLAVDSETSNSYAAHYSFCESCLLVLYFCLFIRTKRAELACHDSPSHNLHGGIESGCLRLGTSHYYDDSNRGSNLRMFGTLFRKTIGRQRLLIEVNVG